MAAFAGPMVRIRLPPAKSQAKFAARAKLRASPPQYRRGLGATRQRPRCRRSVLRPPPRSPRPSTLSSRTLTVWGTEERRRASISHPRARFGHNRTRRKTLAARSSCFIVGANRIAGVTVSITGGCAERQCRSRPLTAPPAGEPIDRGRGAIAATTSI